MKEYRGVAASPGVALGIARVIVQDAGHASVGSTRVPSPRAATEVSMTPAEEWRRLEEARRELASALRRQTTEGSQPAAELFDAHVSILEDTTLVEMLQEAIEVERLSAYDAVKSVFGDFAALFSALDDPLFAARAADVRDLERQLLALLATDEDTSHDPIAYLPPGAIVVMRDLVPSDVVRLDASRVAGIALASGSPLAHGSILARSMGIPVVCRLGEEILRLCDGDECLLDGDGGRLILAPDAATSSIQYTRNPSDSQRVTVPTSPVQSPCAYTADRVPLPTLANLNTLDELALVQRSGADGIGLLRTEFLFARHNVEPTVEEQTTAYVEILIALGDAPCNVRAFDLGGDKRVPWLQMHPDHGDGALTGIRLLFARPQVLRNQYRALLRAIASLAGEGVARTAPVRFLLPMVAVPEEVDAALAMLAEVEAEERFNREAALLEIGAMIEIPSAALMASEIAARCDSMSIGSNDLAQFLFAGDRSQRDAAVWAHGLHPAVLRTVALICEGARSQARPVSLCGEIAANPLATPLLLGLGVSEVSVTPTTVPLVKAALGRYTLEECQTLASIALAAPDTESVLQLLNDFAHGKNV